MKNDKTVIIRADGNKNVAMGHLMRCLVIADALKEVGLSVTFVMAKDDARSVIEDRGFPCHVLHTDYEDMEAELPLFIPYLKDCRADMVLVDSYFATDTYFKELGKICKTACIDDFGYKAIPVDVLINFQAYASALKYDEMYEKADLPMPTLFADSKYFPLRREYTEIAKSRSLESVKDVLISTGGGDLLGIAASIGETLCAEIDAGLHKGIQYHFLCGPFSTSFQRLTCLAKTHSEIVIHEWVDRFWEFLQDFDLAVTAAAITIHEMSAMQLPCVMFYFADNQRQIADWFDKEAGFPNAGDVVIHGETISAVATQDEKVNPEGIQRITGLLSELENDANKRETLKKSMASICDGQGAARLANALKKLLEN